MLAGTPPHLPTARLLSVAPKRSHMHVPTQGAGRLAPQAVERADGLRGVVRRLRSAMGLVHDVPYATSEWMVTNRWGVDGWA